jgi:hypothetical protein
LPLLLQGLLSTLLLLLPWPLLPLPLQPNLAAPALVMTS